ncbi:MAG: hypothetical protein KGY45_01295 [Hadesarchaea archaeon]|nr:hypothetical protein [Hadesarchaea archaeon]
MDSAWPVRNLEYKQLVAIPLIVAVIFGVAIFVNGVPLGMEFSGGQYIEIKNVENMPSSVTEVEDAIKNEIGGEVKLYLSDNGLDIETSLVLSGEQENQLKDTLREDFGIDGDYSTPRRMGSVITSLYQEQARLAVIAAAIVMAIILFVVLRHLTTVGGILSVIGLDLVGIFGCMAILGIPLSLASMAGILLILGYAVNTNILLCTRVLKRVGGSVRDRAADAMSTGVAMSTTSASALIALNLVSTAPELHQLSAVIVIGILVDMMNTWLLNSGIIMKHAEKEAKKYHGKI